MEAKTTPQGVNIASVFTYTPAENANAVTAAVRSLVWLAPDAVVVYDRATTTQSKLFKQFNLVLLAPPKISGSTATAVANGQQITVQSLMPADAALSEQHFWKTDPSQEMDRVADFEPARNRLIIADPAMPANTRFLTVIQGTDAGVKAPTATVIHSTGGTPFDGAYIGNTVVLFPVTVPKSVISFTYQAPLSATRHLITGLVPGVKYALQLTATDPDLPATFTVSQNSGGTAADVGGVVGFGFPVSNTPTTGGSTAGFKMLTPPQ